MNKRNYTIYIVPTIAILELVVIISIGLFTNCNFINQDTSDSIKKTTQKSPDYVKCKVAVYYLDGREETYILDVYEDTLNIFLENNTLWYNKYLFKNQGLISKSEVIGTGIKAYEIMSSNKVFVKY